MRKSYYQETLDFLYSQLPMFQRIGAPAYKKDLTNITALCEALGHPQRNYPVIHVAGTNGKGSVSFMLSAILQAAGWKTGLCVSPHYRDFRERARINGQYVPKAFVVDFVQRLRPVIDAVQPSFFELSTALAFDYFSAEKVDIAVIETGLGGRLDSTNIVEPVLSVITNIGLDHTEFLGNTLPLIAAEKAGIIKQGVPVVIGERHPETEVVFEQTAKKQAASIVFAEDAYQAVRHSGDVFHTIFDVFRRQKLVYPALEVQLSGDFQTKNIQTVLQAVEMLAPQFSIEETHIRSGLSRLKSLTGFLGRWDAIGQNPLVLCDSAHNEHGMKVVMQELSKLEYNRLHIVFGVVKDKDIAAMLQLLPQDARYYFCKANIPRGLDAVELHTKAIEAGLQGRSYASVKNALRAAKRNAAPDDLIFVGGSIFVVAEVV